MYIRRGRSAVAAVAVVLSVLAGGCSSSGPDVGTEFEWVLNDDFLQIRDCRLLEGLISNEIDRILGAGDDTGLAEAAEAQYQRIVAHRDDIC